MRNNNSVLPKVLVAFFSLAALLSLFFVWVRIDVPFIGVVYKLNGFQIVKYVPPILLAINMLAFVLYVFIPTKRLVSIVTSFLNIVAVAFMFFRFENFRDEDTIMSYLGKIPIIDHYLGIDLYSIAEACIKYDTSIILTSAFVLLSFIIAFFVNDSY